MSKFNQKTETTKTTNLAGGNAYKHSSEMELVSAVLTTFLENKYYESGDQRKDRIVELIGKVNDEFVAKLAIVARNQFHLRSVSHLLLGELSKKHRGDKLVSKTLEKIAERPDDLTEVAAYLGGKLPKQIKKGIRRALLKFSPYQLAKYKMEGKKVKLVDLFNLVHPNPKYASGEQAEAWKKLIDGELKNVDTWEARLSSGEDKAKVWHDLISKGKLGYMALLRNLRNIDNQTSEETKIMACKSLTDKEAVIKSKQLPFRFFNAYENVSNRKMLGAIAKALDHSMSNVPEFDGKTLVAIDGSGSMNGDPIEKASILAAALMKKNDADVIIYDTSIKEFKYIPSEPTISIAEKIQSQADGGGTKTSLVFQYAHQKNYDRIIILSDNESWAESYWDGGNVQKIYNEFRKYNGDPFVYAIDIQGYGTKDVTGGKVRHICGFSDKIFDFMKWIEKENEIVDFINKVEI